MEENTSVNYIHMKYIVKYGIGGLFYSLILFCMILWHFTFKGLPTFTDFWNSFGKYKDSYPD